MTDKFIIIYPEKTMKHLLVPASQMCERRCFTMFYINSGYLWVLAYSFLLALYFSCHQWLLPSNPRMTFGHLHHSCFPGVAWLSLVTFMLLFVNLPNDSHKLRFKKRKEKKTIFPWGCLPKSNFKYFRD